MTFHSLTTKNTKEPKSIIAKEISRKNVPFYLKNLNTSLQSFSFDDSLERDYNVFLSFRLNVHVLCPFLYCTYIFVFSVCFVFDFFYAVYNNKRYCFCVKEPRFFVRYFLLSCVFHLTLQNKNINELWKRQRSKENLLQNCYKSKP